MGHRVINRAYLHDVRHHGRQLTEGPTQNRRNGGANTVFTTATTAAAFSQRTRGINLMTSFESIILEPSRFDLMTSLLDDAFNRLPATRDARPREGVRVPTFLSLAFQTQHLTEEG